MTTVETPQPPLTPDVKAFISRCAPHVEAGLSLEEAMQRVMDRDKELLAMMVADNALGEAIRGALSAEVYYRIKGLEAVGRAVDAAADKAASGRKNWR